MRNARGGLKLRAGQLALSLTLACGTFVVLDAGGLAGATVTPPTLTGISTHHGPVSGGTSITITGTGFETGATVAIGQGARAGTGAIAATNVVVVSPTEITATTGGGGKAGTWGTYVSNPDGGVSAPNFASLFVYDPLPSISGINPRTGPTTGGTPITITGTGFMTGATVEISQGSGLTGAIPATGVTVVSSSEITATTGGGANPGNWTLYVLNPDGGTSVPSVASLFDYAS